MGILGKVIVGAILFGVIGSFFGGFGTIIGIILGIIVGFKSDQDTDKKFETPEPIFNAEQKNMGRIDNLHKDQRRGFQSAIIKNNVEKVGNYEESKTVDIEEKNITSAQDIGTDKTSEKDDDYW